MDKQLRHVNIPIFVPHRGCPHSCVFCNQHTITGQHGGVTTEMVCKTVEEHLATLRPGTDVEVAFFGGSFTAIDPCVQEQLLGAVQPYLKSGQVRGIRCSTRPDCINEEIIERLRTYGVTAVELGVQSTDAQVLALSGRGHNAEDAFYAAKLLGEAGIELGLQMMLGLPGDSREKAINTARDIIAMKPQTVRIYPTLVLEGTALHDQFCLGKYVPLTLEETVLQCAVLLQMFGREGISVIRVGLATTDGVNVDTAIGPYHPALRELAEGRMIRTMLEKFVREWLPKRLTINCNPKELSKVIGHKRENVMYFAQQFGVMMNVFADADVLQGQLIVCEKNQKHVLPILG